MYQGFSFEAAGANLSQNGLQLSPRRQQLVAQQRDPAAAVPGAVLAEPDEFLRAVRGVRGSIW